MKRLKESISMIKNHFTSNSRWIEYTIIILFIGTAMILLTFDTIFSAVTIETKNAGATNAKVTANADGKTLHQKFNVITISNNDKATNTATTDVTDAKPSLRITVGEKSYILSDGVYYPEEYLTKHTKIKVISEMITVHTSYSKDDIVYALKSDWHEKSLDVIHQNAKSIIDHFGSKNNGKTIITNNNNSDSNGVIIDNGNRIMLPSITDVTTPSQDNDEDHYPLRLFRILHVGNNMFFVMIGGKI